MGVLIQVTVAKRLFPKEHSRLDASALGRKQNLENGVQRQPDTQATQRRENA